MTMMMMMMIKDEQVREVFLVWRWPCNMGDLVHRQAVAQSSMRSDCQNQHNGEHTRMAPPTLGRPQEYSSLLQPGHKVICLFTANSSNAILWSCPRALSVLMFLFHSKIVFTSIVASRIVNKMELLPLCGIQDVRPTPTPLIWKWWWGWWDSWRLQSIAKMVSIDYSEKWRIWPKRNCPSSPSF